MNSYPYMHLVRQMDVCVDSFASCGANRVCPGVLTVHFPFIVCWVASAFQIRDESFTACELTQTQFDVHKEMFAKFYVHQVARNHSRVLKMLDNNIQTFFVTKKANVFLTVKWVLFCPRDPSSLLVNVHVEVNILLVIIFVHVYIYLQVR